MEYLTNFVSYLRDVLTINNFGQGYVYARTGFCMVWTVYTGYISINRLLQSHADAIAALQATGPAAEESLTAVTRHVDTCDSADRAAIQSLVSQD